MAQGTVQPSSESPLPDRTRTIPDAALDHPDLPDEGVNGHYDSSLTQNFARSDSDSARHSQEEERDAGDADGMDGAAAAEDPEDEEAKRQLTTLEDFARDMSEAAKLILVKRAEFTRVVAVVSYWQNPRNLPHIKIHAR